MVWEFRKPNNNMLETLFLIFCVSHFSRHRSVNTLKLRGEPYSNIHNYFILCVLNLSYKRENNLLCSLPGGNCFIYFSFLKHMPYGSSLSMFKEKGFKVFRLFFSFAYSKMTYCPLCYNKLTTNTKCYAFFCMFIFLLLFYIEDKYRIYQNFLL